jgi:hypothetical protein
MSIRARPKNPRYWNMRQQPLLTLPKSVASGFTDEARKLEPAQ